MKKKYFSWIVFTAIILAYFAINHEKFINGILDGLKDYGIV